MEPSVTDVSQQVQKKNRFKINICLVFYIDLIYLSVYIKEKKC